MRTSILHSTLLEVWGSIIVSVTNHMQHHPRLFYDMNQHVNCFPHQPNATSCLTFCSWGSRARGGLSACNSTAGKRRLRRQWSCNGRWREIFHSETVGGGNLLQRVEGRRQLRFGEGGFISSKTTSFWCWQ